MAVRSVNGLLTWAEQCDAPGRSLSCPQAAVTTLEFGLHVSENQAEPCTR